MVPKVWPCAENGKRLEEFFRPLLRNLTIYLQHYIRIDYDSEYNTRIRFFVIAANNNLIGHEIL